MVQSATVGFHKPCWRMTAMQALALASQVTINRPVLALAPRSIGLAAATSLDATMAMGGGRLLPGEHLLAIQAIAAVRQPGERESFALALPQHEHTRAHVGEHKLWRMGKRPPARGVHPRVSTIIIHGHAAEKASASCCHAALPFSRRRCPHPTPSLDVVEMQEEGQEKRKQLGGQSFERVCLSGRAGEAQH